MTAEHTTAKASKIPMLVNSAASAIGRKPAIRPEPMPTIQVTRTGTRRWAPHGGDDLRNNPSRDIENHTRVTAYMNVHITVAYPEDGADRNQRRDPRQPNTFESLRECRLRVHLGVLHHPG